MDKVTDADVRSVLGEGETHIYFKIIQYQFTKRLAHSMLCRLGLLTPHESIILSHSLFVLQQFYSHSIIITPSHLAAALTFINARAGVRLSLPYGPKPIRSLSDFPIGRVPVEITFLQRLFSFGASMNEKRNYYVRELPAVRDLNWIRK